MKSYILLGIFLSALLYALFYALLYALLSALSIAEAQAVRLGPPVRPRPALALGSLGLSVSPASVSFMLVACGQALSSVPITVQTTANLSALNTLSLYAFFASSAALTSGSSDAIPASLIYGRCPSGSPTVFTAFTQSTFFSGPNGLLVYRTGNLVALGSGRTDSLFLMIDLSTLPQLSAGH